MEDETGRFTEAEARDVFLRWEKRRIVYNAVLLVVGLAAVSPAVYDGFCATDGFGPLGYVVRLAAGAVAYGLAANVCYFLGPLLECYVRWLGLRVPILTQVLFAAGTVFSVALTGFIGFWILASMALSHLWDKLD